MSVPLPSPAPLPGIHRNESYINFEVTFFTFPMLLLVLPIFYMPVTIIIILRIFVKLLYAIKDKNVNVPLFSAICISHIMVSCDSREVIHQINFQCLLFFICDFFYVRLMTSGVFTSWCASVLPNRYLIILYATTFYFNYANMLFPFLVSTMRLILFAYPQNQAKVLTWDDLRFAPFINRTILRTALPIIFIYPFFSIFFMFTAEGFCVQARSPFPFGSVVIAFQGSLFQLRNNYFLLFNNLFWMSSCLINNSILLVKLVQLKMSLSFQARSQKSYKAEVSLTFTTFSMIFSYLSNSMIVIAAQLGGELSYYAIMLRPFGNDLETCVVPWVFYLTHPIFRRKTNTLRVVP
ncbi:hypothetical protein CRE_30038 [Caenorhabditis remanei]|uniref:Serpentine Receptor, class U n=1 Tax=Caenorhabditis remanei TaxID=31234 RepID=E3MMC0_CAERE|nr:hypothetical protein CRE_30038 [Caenorhabditis remanei]